MLRVLLVLEDYGEMLFLQTLLKKMGFDVDGIQNPRHLTDKLLTMNPEVLVMTAYGKRVNGHELVQGLKRPRGLPKTILMHSPDVVTVNLAQADGWLTSPTTAMDFLRALSQVSKVDLQQLTEKYAKLTATNPEIAERERKLEPTDQTAHAVMEKSQTDSGNFPKPSKRTPEREQRNTEFLKSFKTPTELTFDRKKIEDNVKELRRSEDPEQMALLEKERKAFILEMFRKK